MSETRGRSMRICFIGDSLVNGTGDDDGLGWVGRVVARARQGGRDVTAYNLGIRRDTSADVAERWTHEARRRLPAGHDGRLVFSFGVNDCADGDGDGPRVARVALDASLANARAILQAAREWLPTLMVGPPVYAESDRANERIAVLSDGYARLCDGLGVPYLELFQVTRSSRAWVDEALAGDGAHPNRGGYAVVAEAVAAWPAWQEWVGRDRS